MVSEGDGSLFPWLENPLGEALKLHAANALLLHGPDGNGQFQLALAIAQAFLCEGQREPGGFVAACNICAGCRLFTARTHPDLMILVPDSLHEVLGLAPFAAESYAEGASNGKTKPSKEIRVDEVRAVVGFAQSSSARGMGKAVIVHPAERMNVVAANALLKSLEEPAGQTRYVLSSNAAASLLPTVRSRCLAVPVTLATEQPALAWLEAKGVLEARQLLAATGGQPLDAFQWAQSGIDALVWLSLPARLAQGRAETFADWPLARVIQTLQKICHDSLCVAVGAAPRYFPRHCLGGPARDIEPLVKWSAALRDQANRAEHPWQVSLKIESLVDQARQAMSGSSTNENPPQNGSHAGASVHCAP